MKLLGSPRTFPDLPPLWDGVPVRWEKWEKGIVTSLDWHLNANIACDGCGLGSSLWRSTGTWLRSQMGGEWTRRGIRNFHATRCGWCGHTTVFTMHDEQAWTLDESDYGEAGSYGEADANTLF